MEPTPHLDDEVLASWAVGALPDAARASASLHLERCAECRAVLEALKPTERAKGPVSFRPGDKLPTFAERYVPLKLLGQGAMGKVYVAYDSTLDRKVALKVLHESLRLDADAVRHEARIFREAKSLAQLAHPNIVRVYDVGSYRGQTFLTMEYVEGQSLTAWLAEAPRGWREVLEVFVGAGRGLAAAHAARVIHRDFKPDNVLVSKSGTARVADFGLANADEGAGADRELRPELSDLTLTETGTLVGTPAYLAPERFEHRPADALSDQFAFCVALHEALFRAPPFEGDDLDSRRAAVQAGRFRATTSRPLPSWLVAAVRRGMAVDPSARFPSMDALVTALDQEAPRKHRRLRLAWAALGVPLLAGAGVGMVELRQQRCGGGSAALHAVWNPEVEKAVERAFQRSDAANAHALFDRFRIVLDLDGRAWVAAHHEACAATRVRGEQSEALLDLRMACLGRHLTAVGALTQSVLAAPSPDPNRALLAALDLPPLPACADTENLARSFSFPSRRAEREQVERLRRTLVELDERQHVEVSAKLLPLYQQAAKDADALSFRPVQAEALLALGVEEDAARHETVAQDAYRKAILRAEASGANRTNLQARLRLATSLARMHVKGDEAKAQLAEADALLESFDEVDPELEVARGVAAGELALASGDYPSAEAGLRRAVARAEKLTQGPRLLVLLDELGLALIRESRPVEAEAVLRRSLTLTEALYGDVDFVANKLNLLATAVRAQARQEEAIAIYDRALAILALNGTRVTSQLAGTQLNRAIALGELGRGAEAEEGFARAADVLRKHPHIDDPGLAIALMNLSSQQVENHKPLPALQNAKDAIALLAAEQPPEEVGIAVARVSQAQALSALGESKEALTLFADATASLKKRLGADNPYLSDVGASYAEALRAANQPKQALAEAEWSQKIGVKSKADNPLGYVHATLVYADALCAVAKAPARARAIVEAVDLSALSGNRAAQRKIEAWLRAHPPAEG